MNRSICQLSIHVLLAVFGISEALAKEVEPLDNQPQIGDGPKPELLRLEPKLDMSPAETPQPQESRPSGKQITLSGGVVEKNLAIEWDQWHNRLAHAVPPRVFDNVVDALDVPTGATTGIHVEVTCDKHIKTVQVVRSSGNLWFDKWVRDAVYKLEGNYILTFPPNSKRTEVATNFSITKGGKNSDDLELGDIEYAELPLDESAGLEQVAQPSTAKRSSRHESRKTGRAVSGP